MITFDEDRYTQDKALKQDPFEEFSYTTQADVGEKTTFQSNTYWEKSEEKICGSIVQGDAGGAVSEGLDSPTSPEVSVLTRLSSVENRNVDSPSRMHEPQNLPLFDAESLCSEPQSIDTYPTESLCSEDFVENESDQDYVVRILKAQMEEGGILDVTSGRRYDLESAFSKGLVDEMTLLKVLDLLSDDSDAGDEEVTMSVLKQALSDGSISSDIVVPPMEQCSLSRSDSSITISESSASALVPDAVKSLNLDSTCIFSPGENSSQSVSVDCNLGLTSMDEAEKAQQPTEKKVAAMVFDFTDEDEEKVCGSALDGVTRGNVEQMTNTTNSSPPSVSGHEPQMMISPASWNQFTAECIHQTDRLPLLAEDTESEELINNQLTDRADVSGVVMENTSETTQTHPFSLSDRSSDSNTNPQSQTSHSYKPDGLPTNDDFFIAGYNSQISNQTVGKSDVDMTSPHRSVLSEESRVENDTSAVHLPLDDEPTPSIDYSSPRDLVESTITSVSKGDCNSGKNITEDGSRITLPQQAALHSESNFSVESEPRYTKNGQKPEQLNSSSQLPAVSSEISTSNTISQKSCDVEYSEGYTPTVQTCKDSSDSERRGADDPELHTERISPEMQHENVFSHSEQIPVSRNEENTHIHRQVCSLNQLTASSDINSGQSETGMSKEFESDVLPKRKSSDVHASENPQVATDFLSDSSLTSDGASSAASVFPNAPKTDIDDWGVMVTEGAVSNVQKSQTQDAITIAQNMLQALDKGERDMPQELLGSCHPDLLVDLLKQSTFSLNDEGPDNRELLLEKDKVHEKTDHSDVSNVQLQLLQVLKTVSSSQDLSMLQEVMDTLSSALGGDSQEDREHILESIKEESSEGEDEGSAEEDQAVCHRASPQSSANSDTCKGVEVKHEAFSIQDFLEYVGRLQDHADVLDDVKILIQAPMGSNMEELQIQLEECQCLESRLSSLAGGLTEDMEKAKQLLNSADEDIPEQIHQDLASTCLDLEENFTAVSQMCTEKSDSLLKVMETGKVHLESTYQKYLSDLEELVGLIQNNPEMQGMDLDTCDVDTLKYLTQQTKDTESNLLKDTRLKLEDVTLDVQCFISEHAQFLSPAQSSHLLKVLSSTQRAFRDQTERLVTQRSTLDVLLDTRERENQEKVCLRMCYKISQRLHWFAEVKVALLRMLL
ncbi:hypothetical protein INR49_009898 [Caranx melampygus]|nr:hypothetical protein INR49_009898 [Caranx melampygus]